LVDCAELASLSTPDGGILTSHLNVLLRASSTPQKRFVCHGFHALLVVLIIFLVEKLGLSILFLLRREVANRRCIISLSGLLYDLMRLSLRNQIRKAIL
jgi:hypothetical protein